LTSLDCHVKRDEIYRRPQIKVPHARLQFNPADAMMCARWKTNKPRANISKVHLPRPGHIDTYVMLCGGRYSNSCVTTTTTVTVAVAKPQINEICTRCWPSGERRHEPAAPKSVLPLICRIHPGHKLTPDQKRGMRYVQHKSCAGTSAARMV